MAQLRPHERYGVCNLCEAICGLLTVEDRRGRARRRGPRQRGRPALARPHLPQGASRCATCTRTPTGSAAGPPVVGAPTRPGRRSAGTRRSIWSRRRPRTAVRPSTAATPSRVYLGNPNVHSLGSMTHGTAAGQGAAHAQQVLAPPRSTSSRTSSSAHLLFGHQLLLPDPRPRPHRPLPRLRRQPDGLQRQPDDGAGLPGPAARRSRRAAAGWSCSTRAAPRPRRSPTSTTSSARDRTRACCSRCSTCCSPRGSATLPAYVDGLDAVRDAVDALHRRSWPSR